jgi:hypothetical protein
LILLLAYSCTNQSNSNITDSITTTDSKLNSLNNQSNQLDDNVLIWTSSYDKRHFNLITENIPGCYFWQRDNQSTLGFKHHYLGIKLFKSGSEEKQDTDQELVPYKYKSFDRNDHLVLFADCQVPNSKTFRDLLLRELDKRARKYSPVPKTNSLSGDLIYSLQEPCGDHPCNLYWDPIEYAWICVAPVCDEDDGGYPWNPDPGSGGGSSSVPSGVDPIFFGSLNTQEQALCWDSPVQCAMVGLYASWASEWAAQIEPNGSHNGPQDALRHAAWSGRIALEYNAHISLEWTDAHESDSTEPDETTMDLYNNTVGRLIGASANDLQHMTSLILQAYSNNEFYIINQNN